MNPELQTLLSVSIPTLAVLIGILINNVRLNDLNVRLNDLRAHFDGRIDHVDRRVEDLKEMWRAELHRVEGVLDARLSNVEERLRYLEERLR